MTIRTPHTKIFHIIAAAPWTRGFDRSLNAAAGGFDFPDSPRTALFLNGEKIPPRGGKLPKNWYITDLWTDFSIQFIDEAPGHPEVRSDLRMS